MSSAADVSDGNESLGSMNSNGMNSKLNEIVTYNNYILGKSRASPSLQLRGKTNNSNSSIPLVDFCNPPATPEAKLNELINQFYECKNGANILTCKRLLKKISRSIHRIQNKAENCEEISCSKNLRQNCEPDVKFINNNVPQPSRLPTPKVQETTRAEKTTYCRPVISMYNQEFIYKTVERNARLQQLVKKLMVAREREKHNEAWNNYINELKNKHGYYNPESSRIPTQLVQEEDNADTINDYYITRYKCRQSHPCEHLLNDFYNCASNEVQQIENDFMDQHFLHPKYRSYNFENNRYCYPTASQGRLMMLNRERPRNYTKCPRNFRTPTRYYHGNTIYIEKDKQTNNKPTEETQSFKPCVLKLQTEDNVPKELSVQTDMINLEGKEAHNENKENSIKEEYYKVKENVERLKENLRQNDAKHFSLSKIEGKLDVLIDSFNNFVTEVKSKKILTSSKSTAVSCCSVGNTHSASNADAFGVRKPQQIICGVVQERTKSTLEFSGGPTRRGETIDEILYEEMNKSEKVKRDIEDILSKPNRQCAVQITIDIPTKERATEVTESFVHAEQEEMVIEDINRTENLCSSNRRIAIAVNTDPLGLLALLRVSTETVKQILSFVPSIDYVSYLARLPISQTTQSTARFSCNVCGESFSRPSQLSDHIQEHNLGNTRNCCVCRHVLDMKRTRSGLFACQYCGQVFTRAYCRELHQQACARVLGTKHDPKPSLLLLS